MVESWREVAAAQEGLLARRQLRALDIDRHRIRNNVAAGRWSELSDNVVATTTGTLTADQIRWLGVLHAGPQAVVGDLSAAELLGLRTWHPDATTILIPQRLDIDEDVPGIRFVRTRRPIATYRHPGRDLPVCRIEPAVLHFAAYQHSRRTAQGVLAATVQQRLARPVSLLTWLAAMRPLRWAPMFRQVLGEIAGGAESMAELDVGAMCASTGLAPPTRQTRRTDTSGRTRFTDCEWRLPDGRIVVLEVDGAFHMDVEHGEDDPARQRGLTTTDRVVVRCTARELRDHPERVAADLLVLGVPRSCP